NGAPPMRLKLTLAQMQQYDLGSLTLTSGKLSLQVGRVSSSPTTRYFDASGREQSGPERAAYTVTARRYNGEVDVEVKRAPGAALSRRLPVGWTYDVGHGFMTLYGLKGGWGPPSLGAQATSAGASS